MTLYTKPTGFCLNCMKTKVQLKARNIPFKVSHADASLLKKYNYKSYPVVCPNDDLKDTKNNWDGFNYPAIKKYIKSYQK